MLYLHPDKIALYLDRVISNDMKWLIRHALRHPSKKETKLLFNLERPQKNKNRLAWFHAYQGLTICLNGQLPAAAELKRYV